MVRRVEFVGDGNFSNFFFLSICHPRFLLLFTNSMPFSTFVCFNFKLDMCERPEIFLFSPPFSTNFIFVTIIFTFPCDLTPDLLLEREDILCLMSFPFSLSAVL